MAHAPAFMPPPKSKLFPQVSQPLGSWNQTFSPSVCFVTDATDLYIQSPVRRHWLKMKRTVVNVPRSRRHALVPRIGFLSHFGFQSQTYSQKSMMTLWSCWLVTRYGHCKLESSFLQLCECKNKFKFLIVLRKPQLTREFWFTFVVIISRPSRYVSRFLLRRGNTCLLCVSQMSSLLSCCLWWGSGSFGIRAYVVSSVVWSKPQLPAELSGLTERASLHCHNHRSPKQGKAIKVQGESPWAR